MKTNIVGLLPKTEEQEDFSFSEGWSQDSQG